MREKVKYIVLIPFFILVFCVTGHFDNEEYKQVDKVNSELITETEEISCIEISTTYASDRIEISFTQLYETYIINKFTPIVMSACGCTNYKSKYLVACCLRNRMNYYGLDNPLLWGHIEKPYKLTYEYEWELEERLRQIEDSQEAVRHAFFINTEDYSDITYYRVPKDSKRYTDAFFDKLEDFIEVDTVHFYKGALGMESAE